MVRRVFILVLILLAVPFTGCIGEDQADGDAVQVQWTQEPQDRDAGQAIDIAWELTGPEGEIQHTGLHWADYSVSDPQSPADYGNSSGVEQPAQVPGNYSTTVTLDEAGTYHFRAHIIVDGEHRWTPEVEIQISESDSTEAPIIVSLDDHSSQGTVNESLTANWSLSGTPDEVEHTGFHWADFQVSDPQSPADYGNSSGVQQPAQVPGEYNASFTEDEAGTYYGRAHAIYNGQHYWSQEVSFEVQAASGAGGDVTHHVVEMSGFQFQPSSLTVQPGDTINWTNLDNTVHTATFEDQEHGTDSGDVESGDYYNWTVPEDTPTGTYDYRCTYHSQGYSVGMVGDITVENAS